MPTDNFITERLTAAPTPGPWLADWEVEGWWGGEVPGCRVSFKDAQERRVDHALAICLSQNIDKAVAIANARLMAAAPDLLAAAKAALVYDAAIRHRGFIGKGLEPAPGLPGALATGADLDALYWDWQEKSAAAVAKADGPK